jgi:hypothetical protein
VNYSKSVNIPEGTSSHAARKGGKLLLPLLIIRGFSCSERYPNRAELRGARRLRRIRIHIDGLDNLESDKPRRDDRRA